MIWSCTAASQNSSPRRLCLVPFPLCQGHHLRLVYRWQISGRIRQPATDVVSGIVPDEGGIPLSRRSQTKADAARKKSWPHQCLTNIPQRYVLREVLSAGLEARALRQAGCLPLQHRTPGLLILVTGNWDDLLQHGGKLPGGKARFLLQRHQGADFSGRFGNRPRQLAKIEALVRFGKLVEIQRQVLVRRVRNHANSNAGNPSLRANSCLLYTSDAADD